MSTRNRVLSMLLQSEGEYISGNDLAKILGVSRTSIWKAINSLEKDGYIIDAVTNKGYCISNLGDILSKEGVENHLKNKIFDIEIFKSLESTNTYMKTLANNGAKEAAVVATTHQTKGRGRLGRTFYSPDDTGVYFTILLRPKIKTDEIMFLTTLAAVSVCEAINQVTGQNPKIKWVNDIFLNDKKVCGILSEATLSMEDFSVDYVALGIGINVYPPKDGFPTEIENIAGYILEERQIDIKNRIVANVLDNIWDNYNEMNIKQIALKYKNLSYILGEDIFVLKNGEKIKAHAVDLDENCHLIVSYEDGTKESLVSGEVSIRLD